MKVHYASLLTVMSAVIIFSGCVKEKSKDNIVNTFDTTSIAYVPPLTTLLSTPPSDIEINSSTVTVRWEGSKDVVGVQYKLDDEDWSDVITLSDVTVSDLDEGEHIIIIRAQHKNGSLEIKPHTVKFKVNAVHGPALMFLKRKKIVKQNTVFQYFVKAEEVDSLMGFSGVIIFNSTRLQVNSITTGNVKKYPNLVWEPYSVIDNVNGKVRLDLAIFGGSPVKGFSGTDTLFILHCTTLSALGETQVTFDSTKFRNTMNKVITITNVDGKVVVVR